MDLGNMLVEVEHGFRILGGDRGKSVCACMEGGNDSLSIGRSAFDAVLGTFYSERKSIT